MEHLLGWLFFLIIFFFIFFFTKKNKYIRKFLIISFILRLLLVLLDYYNLVNLPDSSGDAIYFEVDARNFSRNEGLSIIFNLFVSGPYFMSKIISIFYTVFGESALMARGISVALGTMSVYLVYHICYLVWDIHSARRASLVATFFPTLILYSTLILREVYIVFFLLLALIATIRFIKTNSFISFLQVIIIFFLLSFFHGPVSLGGLTFLLYILLGKIKKQLINLYNYKINLSSLFISFILFIPFYLFLNNSLVIPYLGTFESLINFEQTFDRLNSAYFQDAASYPTSLMINNGYEIFTKGTLKIFYFLYSPFIWDVSKPSHILGFIDGISYFILTIYVIKNWNAVWENPVTKFFVLLFVTYLIIYGIGVGNFGTVIRHRSKFVMILIILAAPKLHKFIFSTNKKLYKR